MDALTHDRKLALLGQPHMQLLVAYREDLIARTGKVIPHFDPEDGGANAELLFLLSPVPSRNDHGSSTPQGRRLPILSAAFGVLILTHRKRLKLSKEELAGRAHIAPHRSRSAGSNAENSG